MLADSVLVSLHHVDKTRLKNSISASHKPGKASLMRAASYSSSCERRVKSILAVFRAGLRLDVMLMPPPLAAVPVTPVEEAGSPSFW